MNHQKIEIRNCKECMRNLNVATITKKELYYSIYDRHIYNSIDEVEMAKVVTEFYKNSR